MPKVSVIIPVYNVEAYLKQCLDSVINQTLDDIEIICINDGSTDSSLNILQEYAKKDKRIVIINQKNTGLSNARQRGMDICQGEYVAHIDSDDFIELNFLQSLYTVAKNQNADISVSTIKFFDNNNNFQTATAFSSNIVCKNLFSKIAMLRNDSQSFWISVVNKLFSKKIIDILKTSPNPDGLNLGEDCLWMTKAAYFANKIVSAPEACYYYRKNPNSLTHINDKHIENDKKRTVQEITTFLKNSRFPRDCYEVVILNFIYHNLCKASDIKKLLSEYGITFENSSPRYRFLTLVYKFAYKITFGNTKNSCYLKYVYTKQLKKFFFKRRVN